MTKPLVWLAFGPMHLVAVSADVLAIGALLAAALGSAVVTAVFGAAALVVGGVAMWVHARSDPRSRLAGRYTLGRMALAGALASMAARSGAPWLFWASLVLTALVVVGEQTAGVFVRYAVPYAANIPGVVTWNRSRVPQIPILALAAGALLAGYLAMTASAWLVVVQAVCAVAALGWWVAFCVDAGMRVIARQRFSRRLRTTLTRLAPTFVLHWDAPEGTAYQAGMWLPELERIGEPYFVLVRNATCFDDVVAMTDRPVILLKYLEDLDACIVPSLAGAFYVNNGIRNQHLTRFPEITHVQLNHGDSDKAPSFNPVFRMYDYDFVAGQAAIDRFAANGVSMPKDMFRIVGRPQVRDITVVSGGGPAGRGSTVLYAPTWAGFTDDAHYSSLPHCEPIIRALLQRGCRVIFRPHPHAYKSAQLAERCRWVKQTLADDPATGHLFGQAAETDTSLVECFNSCDAMISDVSSVVADFLYSEKPLGMIAVGTEADRFREEFPVARAAYVLTVGAGAGSGGPVADADRFVDDLLADTELSAVRRSLKGYYLGDIPASEYGDRFVREARDVLGVQAARGVSAGLDPAARER